MRDVNKVILIGRLGANPTQIETKTGVPMVQFPLATARHISERNAQGEEKTDSAEDSRKETQWHRVISFGKQAEHCAQYLKKGHAVYVEGSLRSHPYEDKKGVEKISFEVFAREVNFLGSAARPREAAILPS